MTLTVTENERLSSHTTLQVGGPAEQFVTVTSETELEEAVAYATEHNLPITLLGGGSNVLVSDKGVPGLVIKNAITGFVAATTDTHATLTVGAGEDFDSVIERTVAAGWWGLENLSHIPGSVGATPIQNVGAYGVEIADRIESVKVYDTNSATWRELTAADCQFGYRHSIFKRPEGANLIVATVTLKLQLEPQPVLTYRDLANRFPEGSTDQAAIRAAVIAIRAGKFPDWHTVGTAGSFFKNPVISAEQAAALQADWPELPQYRTDDGRVKVPLGYLLDKVLGIKGEQVGAVGAHEAQALVLINHGGASAAEITAYAASITERIKRELGITIEWEVTPLPYRPTE